ncbi:hypothetical protein LQ939_16105 [Pantoea alhagi]|uniref:hypothetical protein n=1 Tax=Pantoea alhagi TaxID=1891675 RepID=UPI00202B40C2|nr:hypothetical protein [Pantoea alhagi]URQ62671.1 hypothetical protein LQ939_16105 [Pantoea alhagi]
MDSRRLYGTARLLLMPRSEYQRRSAATFPNPTSSPARRDVPEPNINTSPQRRSRTQHHRQPAATSPNPTSSPARRDIPELNIIASPPRPAVQNYNLTAFSVKLPCYISCHFLKDPKAMFEINPVKNRIQDLTERSDVLRGYL